MKFSLISKHVPSYSPPTRDMAVDVMLYGVELFDVIFPLLVIDGPDVLDALRVGTV